MGAGGGEGVEGAQGLRHGDGDQVENEGTWGPWGEARKEEGLGDSRPGIGDRGKDRRHGSDLSAG